MSAALSHRFYVTTIEKQPVQANGYHRSKLFLKNCVSTYQGELAATFDLAAFGLYMIAPVKKSVNHSKTLTSMREVQ